MNKVKYLTATGCTFAIIAIVAVVAAFTAGCTSDTATGQGYGQGQGVQGGNYPVLLPMDDSSPLTEQEISDILYMREEEQLAHDLYVRWAGLYPQQPIFSNIADSEAMHAYEVQLLIDRYGLPDVAGDASAGYYHPEIQALYDTLGPQGDASLTAALELGVAVEELDIEDLDKAIASTSRTDILQVWSNLREGSENHMSAFLKNLGRQA